MEHHTEVFTGFGEPRMRAEAVADPAAKQARAYIASGVPVSRYLADQLLVPFALAGTGSVRTGLPSLHTTTHIAVIRRFFEVRLDAVRGPRRPQPLTLDK